MGLIMARSVWTLPIEVISGRIQPEKVAKNRFFVDRTVSLLRPCTADQRGYLYFYLCYSIERQE